MHLLIIKSHKPSKKFDAVFIEGTDKKVVPFGSSDYQDYTQHKDINRRRLYIKRHRKNEDWNDYQKPGTLSRFILWGGSTNIYKNIKAYKKKFNLI